MYLTTCVPILFPYTRDSTLDKVRYKDWMGILQENLTKLWH